MSTLQTKAGLTVFKAQVVVDGVELVKEGDKVKAVLNGEVIGSVVGETVVADGKKIKIESLKSAINPADLVGKDPLTLSNEELTALTEYLKDIAAGKITAAPAVEEKPAAKKDKPAGKKPTKKPAAVEVDEEEEDEDEEVSLPEGVETYEDLEGKSTKELWAIAKPLNLEGVNSRSKKNELVAAIAEFFDLEAPVEEEDEDDIEEDELEEVLDEEEEDFDDDEEEDEEEDLDEDEDDEDYDEEDEDEEEEEEDDEDDEDYDEDEEEEDEEDDDLDVTEKDIDELFKADNKEAIVAFCRKHGVTIPKRKLTKQKLKQIIKDQIFGEE